MTDKELERLQDIIFNNLVKTFQEKGISVVTQKLLMEGIFSRFLVNASIYRSLSDTLNEVLEKEDSPNK